MKAEPSKISLFAKLFFLCALILCLVPVFYVGRFHNGFTYWNAIPIVFAFITMAVFRCNFCAIGFAIACAGSSIVIHLAWIFDWGRIQTGSSTSALIFIFLPFWSFLLGWIGAGIGWGIGRFVLRSKFCTRN